MVYYCTYKGHTTWLSRQFHELRPMYPAKRWTSKSKYLTVWDLAWLQNRITWNSTTSILLSLQPGDYITLQGFFQTHTHTAQWNVIITHCIVVTNRHTQQGTLVKMPGQTQSRTDIEYSVGVKISWDKHLVQRKPGQYQNPSSHTDKGSNNTLILHKRSCFFSSHSTELQFTSPCQSTLHKGSVFLSLSLFLT